jgi:transposase InsO family protein
MIVLIERQAERYPAHSLEARLEQADLTPSGYRRLRQGLVEQTVRESAVPEGDLQAAVEFFVENPQVGAGKARASLLDQEKACLSTSNLNELKRVLSTQAEALYQRRQEEEKQLEEQLREDLRAQRALTAYEHFRAEYPNHIWSIDFSNIKFLGMTFALALVYDEYSQAYLAVGAGCWADGQLAVATFQKALLRSPQSPVLLRRDNGRPFQTEDFQRLLGAGCDHPIPPGSPWYNGSLESGNTSLKAAIKTVGMQTMATAADVFRQARQDQAAALALLAKLAERVRIKLNEDISRLKHGMPPIKVFEGRVEETRARQAEFKTRKQQERLNRMADFRTDPDGRRAPQTLRSKMEAMARRIITKMETSALYVLTEALHCRFRLFET